MGKEIPSVASIPRLLPASIPSASIPFPCWHAPPAHGTWPPALRIGFLNTWAFQSLLSLILSSSGPTDNSVMRISRYLEQKLPEDVASVAFADRNRAFWWRPTERNGSVLTKLATKSRRAGSRLSTLSANGSNDAR